MIDSIHQETQHSVRRICEVLEVARSSYYNAKIETHRQQQDKVLGENIEKIFRFHKLRYGYRRILEDLNEKGIKSSPERVRRLMKQRNLHAIQPKTYVPRTSDGRADAPSPNLIADEGLPNEPNRVFAGDITHIPIAKDWLYLAVVIDLYTRKIVGWKLADHMRAELVTEALANACVQQPMKPGAIFHSDRGSQYGSMRFRSLLNEKKMCQSSVTIWKV
jgi:putative transposase